MTQSRSIVTVDVAKFAEECEKKNGVSEDASVHCASEGDPNAVVFCTGKEVFHYPFHSDGAPYHIDKRSYKGGALPSTIRICPKTGRENVMSLTCKLKEYQTKTVIFSGRRIAACRYWVHRRTNSDHRHGHARRPETQFAKD